MHSTDTTPRSATRLDIASDTIEDYLATARPPVADHLDGRFAVVQRATAGGPASDLVTVDDGGELLHVRRPDADETVGNDAGWVCTLQAVPDTRRRRPGESLPERGPIREITAFAQGSRTYALVHYAGAGGSRHVEPIVHDHAVPPEDRRFRVFVTDGDLRNALSANSQNAVFRDRDGRHYLYGAAVNFRPDTATLFIAAEGQGGVWQAYAARVPGDAQTTFRLLPAASSHHQFIILKIDGDRLAVQESRLLAEEGYEPRIDLADDAWRPANLAAVTGPEPARRSRGPGPYPRLFVARRLRAPARVAQPRPRDRRPRAAAAAALHPTGRSSGAWTALSAATALLTQAHAEVTCRSGLSQ